MKAYSPHTTAANTLIGDKIEEVDIVNKTVGAKLFVWEVPGLINTEAVDSKWRITGPIKEAIMKYAESSNIPTWKIKVFTRIVLPTKF